MANIETVPFTFDELYTEIETQFADAGFDTAEGSNTSQLVTAMAYLTSMLNVNTAVNINETLLPLAKQRNNVVQDARALGYEIQHRQSYKYKLTLMLPKDYSYNIPKYTEFTVGTYSYYYMGDPLTYSSLASDTNIELTVTQGKLYKSSEFPSSLEITTGTVIDETGATVPQYYIDIPFVNVEENGIEAFVTYYDDVGILVTKEEWTKSEQFMIDNDLDLNTKFYRLDDIEFKTPRIYFQISGVGDGLREGSIVNMNVLTSDGVGGGIDNIADTASVIHGIKDTTNVVDVTVLTIALLAEGTDEESINSIKENAPKFYNSANRAVTKSDYEAISNRQSTVEKTGVWGGDEEFPKSPGHIWFSYKPSRYNPTLTADDAFNVNYTSDYGNYIAWDYSLDSVANAVPWNAQFTAGETYYSSLYLENSEISTVANTGVWDVLDNYKIPTITYHNRHPIFIDFEYDVQILKYQVQDSKATVNSEIFGVMNDFFIGSDDDDFQLGNFETEYFHSSLEKRIDTYLTDTSGYNNAVKTSLLLTKKNISVENTVSSYRDLYIPLSVPLEDYTDNAGNILTTVLPVIDTNNFNELDTFAIDPNLTASFLATGQNLQVRWDEVLPVAPTETDKVITAPVRITQQEILLLNEGVNFTAAGFNIDVSTLELDIYPDDPVELEAGGTPLYNEITIEVDTAGNGTFVAADGTFARVDAQNFTLAGATNVASGDNVRITINRKAGTYYLFNDRIKYVLVHLYVDAGGYSDTTTADDSFDDPKSYLSTLDGFYQYTVDNKYLTTEGFSIDTAAQLDSYTGPIVKQISTQEYIGSPIKMPLFRRDRYLNLLYNSPNFSMVKNIIPRLKRVTFS